LDRVVVDSPLLTTLLGRGALKVTVWEPEFELNEELEFPRSETLGLVNSSQDEEWVWRVGRRLFVLGYDAYVPLYQGELPSLPLLRVLAPQVASYLSNQGPLEGGSMPHWFQWALRGVEGGRPGFQIAAELGPLFDCLVEAYHRGWLHPAARKHFLYLLAWKQGISWGDVLTVFRAQWWQAVHDYCERHGLTQEEFRAQVRENRHGKTWADWSKAQTRAAP
jgi:hypothetical protein